MTSINVLKNKIPVEQAQALVEIMRSKDLLTTLCGLSGKEIALDWSNQGLGAGDTVLIANDIKNHLALSSVNMLNNGIGVEQANALVDIMKSKDNLKTLCGFSGDETELDLSSKRLTPGCAVLVANEVKNNGAVTNLDISNNRLGGYYNAYAEWISDMNGIKALAAAIPECK